VVKNTTTMLNARIESGSERASIKALFSSSPASGRPALHEGLFYISVPRWIFLLTFFPGSTLLLRCLWMVTAVWICIQT
jgi:hypothetical protein